MRDVAAGASPEFHGACATTVWNEPEGPTYHTLPARKSELPPNRKMPAHGPRPQASVEDSGRLARLGSAIDCHSLPPPELR